MSPRRFLLATIGLSHSLGVAAAAQSALRPGAHVRVVVANGPRMTGTFVRWAGDSFEVALNDPPRRVRIASGMVRRLEISGGRGTGAGKGALIGGALGVASGMIFALTTAKGDLSRSQFLAFGGAGFGVLGGALGFFFGSFTTIEKWERGTLPPVGARSELPEWIWGVHINMDF